MNNKRSICIIDDDRVHTYGVKKIVRSYFPENMVITFENGREALDGLENLIENGDTLPDIILLDIDMPEMNGWDFLKELDLIKDSSNQHTQIFVVSSHVNDKIESLYNVEWVKKVKEFIRKPVHAESLKKLLSEN